MSNKENNKKSLVLLDENVDIDKLMDDFVQKGIIPKNHKHPKTFTRDIADAYFLSKDEKNYHDWLKEEIEKRKDANETAGSRLDKLEKLKIQFESHYEKLIRSKGKLNATSKIYQNLIDVEKQFIAEICRDLGAFQKLKNLEPNLKKENFLIYNFIGFLDIYYTKYIPTKRRRKYELRLNKTTWTQLVLEHYGIKLEEENIEKIKTSRPKSLSVNYFIKRKRKELKTIRKMEK